MSGTVMLPTAWWESIKSQHSRPASGTNLRHWRNTIGLLVAVLGGGGGAYLLIGFATATSIGILSMFHLTKDNDAGPSRGGAVLFFIVLPAVSYFVSGYYGTLISGTHKRLFIVLVALACALLVFLHTLPNDRSFRHLWFILAPSIGAALGAWLGVARRRRRLM